MKIYRVLLVLALIFGLNNLHLFAKTTSTKNTAPISKAAPVKPNLAALKEQALQSLATLNAPGTASGSTTFYPGSNVELKANVPTGVSVQWLKEGTPINGAAALTYAATETGNYSFTLNNGTCVSLATNSIQVAAIKPKMTLQNTALTSSSLQGNQWLQDGVALEGEASATLTASHTGNYAETSTQNGRSITSEAVYVFVKEPEIVQSFTLFPNPAATFIQIKYTSPHLTDKVLVTIYDSIGNMIENFYLTQRERGLYQQELNLAKFAGGIYFVRVKDGTQTLVKKFARINL